MKITKHYEAPAAEAFCMEADLFFLASTGEPGHAGGDMDEDPGNTYNY